MSSEAFHLERTPVHLGLGAVAHTLPDMDGSGDWYARYGAATAADGTEGRLVSMYTFDGPWTSWEVHPNGEELVVCVAGAMKLYQEIDGVVSTVDLEAGQAIINPRGAWHTADVEGTATALFVTAGAGTENRAR